MKMLHYVAVYFSVNFKIKWSYDNFQKTFLISYVIVCFYFNSWKFWKTIWSTLYLFCRYVRKHFESLCMRKSEELTLVQLSILIRWNWIIRPTKVILFDLLQLAIWIFTIRYAEQRFPYSSLRKRAQNVMPYHARIWPWGKHLEIYIYLL